MKTLTALPVLASAVDDTATLLSLKMHSTLETGVDHLLDAVGSRNVTQMSSLIQNLVEDSISSGVMELDHDVHTALDLIKTELLEDIRKSLAEAHCYDQSALHEAMSCFEKCEEIKGGGGKSCGERCDGSVHKQCRTTLFGYYKDHITKCRDLDHYVATAIKPCPMYKKGCCYLPHTTWNCEGPCEGTIKGLKVNDDLGHWLLEQAKMFRSTYETWHKLYESCKHSYRVFIEKDAECDCKQAECETRNCEWDTCQYMNCNDDYQRCWGACEAASASLWCKTECLEKDRKIDWSATEKIECYVNVMLEQPTTKQLLETCGSENCYNDYRTKMYMKCNDICPEVDYDAPGFKSLHDEHGNCKKYEEMVDIIDSWDEFRRRDHVQGKISGKKTEVIDQDTDNEADQDVTEEGRYSVRTRHRSAHSKEEMRCVSHLDIDWVLPPCCHPCPELPPPPCTDEHDMVCGKSGKEKCGKDSYMWTFYGQYDFLSPDQIWGFDYDKCPDYATMEHTYEYAYNLCKCIDCPRKPKTCAPSCTETKACKKDCRYNYDYHKHLVAVDCDKIDDQSLHDWRVGTKELGGNKIGQFLPAPPGGQPICYKDDCGDQTPGARCSKKDFGDGCFRTEDCFTYCAATR